MKTLSFIGTGRYFNRPVLIDFNKQTVETIDSTRCGMNECYIVPEDLEVRYKKDGKYIVTKANKGDIIVTFYREEWIINPVIVVKNKEWKENILAYIKRQEARKSAELVEANYSSCCDKCNCDCDCA